MWDADCDNSVVWADRSRRTKGGVACYWRVRSQIGSVESRKADIDAAIWTCIGIMPQCIEVVEIMGAFKCSPISMHPHSIVNSKEDDW